MKVIMVSDIGSTPARVHRPSGTIFLNQRFWHTLDEQSKKVILAHEIGHYKLQTTSEILADEYAFQSFALSEPGSLKALFRTLVKVLDLKNPFHRRRIWSMLKRITKTDAALGNPKAAKIYNSMTSIELNNLRARVQAQSPYATPQMVDVALLFAAAMKQDTSGFSDASGKKSAFKRFFDKAGDVFRKVAKNPIFVGTVSAAGVAVGVPPAVTAGAIGVLDAKSNANVMKARAEGEAKRAAEMRAAMAERNPNLAIGANVTAPVTSPVEQVYTSTSASSGTAAIANTPDTQAQKKSVPLVAWIGLAVLVLGAIAFFTLRKN